MTFGIRLLQTLFPKQEAQRMELRRTILEAEACAEDLKRTIQGFNAQDIKRLTQPVNGKAKDV